MPSFAHTSPARAGVLALALAALAAAFLAAALVGAGPAHASPAGPPPLSIQPSTLDFDMVEVDDGGRGQSFWIQHDGSVLDPVRIHDVYVDGPDSGAFWVESTNCEGGDFWPGAGCNVNVRFDPWEGRDFSATLHVITDYGELTAPIVGTGAQAKVVATPSPLEFGSVAIGARAARSVTLRNVGNAPFQAIVVVVTGGQVAPFRVVSDGCSLQVLLPTLSCSLQVRFEPEEPGHAEANLVVVGGNGFPTVVPVSGEGAEPSSGQSALGAPTSSGLTAAPPAPASQAPTATPTRSTTAAPARTTRPARVAFTRDSALPARARAGRMSLGLARCVGVARCRVAVKTRFVSRLAGARGSRRLSVRGATTVWKLRHAARVSVPVPAKSQGLVRAVIELRVKAPGHRAGVQRLRVRL